MILLIWRLYCTFNREIFNFFTTVRLIGTVRLIEKPLFFRLYCTFIREIIENFRTVRLIGTVLIIGKSE